MDKIIPLKKMLVCQSSEDEIVGVPAVNILCSIYAINQNVKTMRLILEMPDSPEVAFILTQMKGKQLCVNISYSFKEERESSD